MECTDKKCAKHGSVRTHGRLFVGRVIEAKAQRTATIEWERRKYVQKYERYEKRRTQVKAHNPPCIDAKKGERVRILECRPLSKTKHFVIMEKLGTDIAFMAKEEELKQALPEAKEAA